MPTDPQELKKMMHEALFGGAGSVTMAQFTKALDVVVKQILAFEKKLLNGNSQASDDLKRAFAELRAMNKDMSVARMSDFSLFKKEVGRALATLDEKIQPLRDGVDGIDGTTPTKKELTALIKPLIPKVKEGKDGSPDTGEEIIDKINSDKSDKLIRRGQIEGLDDIDTRLRTSQANISSMLHFSGSTVLTADISDQLNGVLKTFTLPSNARVLLVLSSSTPNIMRPTVDYTTTSSQISFTAEISASTTLATGQSVIILYKLP